MNNVEHYLLSAIHDGNRYLKNFIDGSPANYTDTDAVLKTLKTKGLIQHLDDLGPYSITAAGINALITENERRLCLEQQQKNCDDNVNAQLPNNIAKPEKNVRHDLKVSVISEIVSVSVGKLIEGLHVLIELFLTRFFML